MNRYYLTVLLLLFTAVSVLQATNVKIEPLKESTYNDWEPTYDNPLTFLVSVTGVQSSGSISFSFTQVSSWPGVYMNKDSDIEIENSRPDLRFYASDQSKDAYANVEKAREDKKLPEGLPALPPGNTRNNYDPDDVKWVVADDGSTATFSWTSDAYLPQEGFTIKITVKSKDGGSFGILQATFNGNATINIPKDDNGNYIADKCDTDYGYTKPPLDNEKGPTGQPNTVENNTQIGDGLVDFEEYRGFEVNGIHIRLNPTRKDIFIYSPSHLGIGYASDLRKKIFDIHEILESETKNKKKDRTVNFNSLGTPIQFRAGENEPWRVMAKKAIWIEDDLSETVEIPGESHGDGTISIYTKYIENETLGLMTSTDRRGCPWTDAEDAENKYTAKALGHEIGHEIGLKHPWESGVGVDVNGNVVGRVPQPNPVIPNLDLATNAKGWIGLYAFDNQTSPIDEIKRRSKIFKAWSDLEKNAQTAGSNAGLLGGIEKKKEAIAAYRKRPDYQAALKKRNYYWQAPDADPYGENNDTVFSLKRHTHISGKVTTSEGPFTYTYGTTIMDYDFFAHGPGNKLQGIYTPSPSPSDADAVYPSFHNWEYDLGVPVPRAGIVWTPRPNPVPVPCGGTPVEQPEQSPTTPSNQAIVAVRNPAATRIHSHPHQQIYF